MKSRFTEILVFALMMLTSSFTYAGPGDTTTVRAHDNAHMSWWGSYDAWGVFPSAVTTYRRINLDLTLGCPSNGCSDWDYTVQLEALRPTGTYDSTLVQAPYYTIGTNSPDTIRGNTNQVYVTFFNSTTGFTDSSLAGTFQVMIHNNSTDPFAITDSVLLYNCNYYNYYHDNQGNIIDSIFVGFDTTLLNAFTPTYNVFEVIERIELARVITPYGGYYPNTWRNTVTFDVTDFASILQDSVKLRAFYGGWSDGFTITLDFHFIEGTPPRTVQSIRNVYVSGPGGFPYGNANNSIENYLTPKTFALSNNETNAMLRVIPTGHGAGTQNCAEFCLKNYQVLLNGTQYIQQPIWRNDCGKNHLIRQAGTWIYDRANWCPGEKGVIREHELTPLITPGSNLTIDMNLDPFTNTVGGQNPNYIMAVQLITYNDPNYNLDVSMEDIIAPSNNFYHNRSNPICQNPKVVIKNTGSNNLTSATITYGIKGAVASTFNWTGNLGFNQTAVVQLGSIDWNSTTNQPDKFYAYVSNPNGGTDQYALNDTMTSTVMFPVQHPSSFVLLFKSNLAPNENTYNIKDSQGNTVFSNGILAANTIYRDTVSLAPGCYTFTMNDSGKDGLYFFANSDGTGYVRFVNAFGPGVLKYFESDFGSNITYQFTVGYLLEQPEIEQVSEMLVYPNPTSDLIHIDMALPTAESGLVEVLSLDGKTLFSSVLASNDSHSVTIDMSNYPAGIYMVRYVSANRSVIKKAIKR